mgnify:CR=1 FL=1
MATRIHCGLATLALCAVLARAALAADIYVATTGNDGWPGTAGQPKRTIKGGISAAASGDTVRVKAGTYNESWIYVKSGVTVVSEDGVHAAKVYSGGSVGFRFEGASNAVVDGFECHADYAGGTGYYDGLLRVYNASNCTFRNMLAYDAPRDADVIKIGGTGAPTYNTLIENCIVYNPSPRNGDLTGASGYQECIDCFPPDGVVIRGCWLYLTVARGGDVLTFCKGGSRNITWENNVFGPVPGNINGNPSCIAGGPSPEVFPACTNFVARNNLFLECSGDGAFGLLGVQNAEFYNNVIWNYHGGRCAVEFYTAKLNWPYQNDGFKFYNNIVMQTNGKPVFFDRGIWTADGTYIPKNFTHDNNVYYQVQVTTGSPGTINITAEANSLINVNPLLAAPAAPVPGTDTWKSTVDRFRLQATSPAINAGADLSAFGVTTDIFGASRPVGIGYDIGVHEFTWPADVTRDGKVNVFDLQRLAQSWNKQEGQPGYDPACDLTGDKQVNVFDLQIMAQNWNKTL